MLITRVFALATTVVLAGALPLSVVAARGFRGTPFGAVLRPLPVVLLAFIVLNANTVVGVTVPPVYDLVASMVTTVAALISAANAVVLLTERRKV